VLSFHTVFTKAVSNSNGKQKENHARHSYWTLFPKIEAKTARKNELWNGGLA
jgi:hypothetical protein